MKLLMKYAKPVAGILVLCICFLFFQAIMELTLPNEMSNLVNVGLQRSGVSESVPQAISEDGLRLFKNFMSEQDYAEFAGYYSPYAAEADAGLAKKLPGLSEGDLVYSASEADTERAAELYGKGSYALVMFLSEYIEQLGVSGEMTVDEESGVSSIDITMLYGYLDALDTLPASVFEGAIGLANQTESSIRNQVSVTLTQLFYKELGADMNQIQRSYILTTGLKMLGIALLVGVSAIMVGYLASRVAAGISKNMRRDIFSRVMSFSNEEFTRFSTASLITRTTNDVQQVSQLLTMGIRMLAFAPIMAVGGTIMALRKSLSLSWIIALAVVVLLGLIMVIYATAVPKFKKLQQLIDRLNLVSRENLTGMMVIRAFGNEKHEEQRFAAANQDLTKTFRFVQKIMAVMMPVMSLVLNVITLLIVWVGSNEIAKSAMPIGDMLAFIQYAMNIIMSFLMIAVMFVMVPRAAVSINRINEVLEIEPKIKDCDEPKTLENPRGVVEFRGVNFKYGGAEDNALHNINFTVKPGETTAIIGSTGSGKSTLVNLIPRFYDVTEGEVLFDGVDVRALRQHELRDYIGFVPQKAVLFSGDIESNMRYGKHDANEAAIYTALDIAQAREFVEKFDDGLEHPIAQGATNVSGGQKQRLSIARAVVKQPLVYVFDDSFSALDFATDAKLRRALKEKTGDAAVVLVAQRVSTIMGAEQIVVLDGGEIAGVGTHDELLESCPVYREIAQSQMTQEELQ